MSRIPQLDYLRGLAALTVMFFHFHKWNAAHWDANGFLGKCGVYAVSVFFVLSGLTLTLAYGNPDKPLSWKTYAVKRICRIFPLLWVVTLATLILDETPYSAARILLNFTGLFGFFDPAGDIALGAWSIGNELVYYLAFPFLLWLGLHNRPLFYLVFICSVVIAAGYGFLWTDTRQTITVLWPVYVQPLNHAFFFMSGMALALERKRLAALPVSFWQRALALCLLLFVFYTPGANPAGLITGPNRAVLSVLAIGLTGAWYATAPAFSPLPDRILRWLGEISYSVYLLHPLVYRCLKALYVSVEWDMQAYFWGSIILVTLLASHLTYRYLEHPLMRSFRRAG